MVFAPNPGRAKKTLPEFDLVGQSHFFKNLVLVHSEAWMSQLLINRGVQLTLKVSVSA